ncbi:ankyrin [Laetiporus sulphureus 93-53]|uniref:Ankyrin n=1 Tax=Laetiporus sulphureus 93-53 TaxID=1314785 RepID=A0A165FPA6_9APHY|nr:ankyrin [Laetiporus sulphureus 93-53]KZT09270.1 ankyrin [Laetiporus sulphureus 93-53]
MSQTPGTEAFLSRIAQIAPGPTAFDAISEALKPSLDDEAALRKLFATDKNNGRLSDPHVGLIDVFNAPASIRTTRARVVKDDDGLKSKFVMPLSDDHRRKDGTPSMVQSLDDFKKNWAIFAEGFLSQLTDWNNVIAAGGSLAKVSKRAFRKYFHNNAYPTSDVDLFLYGMTTAQAEVKINAIYEAVRDSVPWDVTCVRTKHTVSIHSQYPYRSVQIVLRLYASPAEVLAGFDVDSPCCAYDGERVWASPRAIAAMMRQCNTVDVTRRSPSYEVRLAKYSLRDFEVYVPTLKREDIDPTIFERSIARIQGLARLLVLERLTSAEQRQNYLIDRRRLRGRPDSERMYQRNKKKKYKGDLKAATDFSELEMNDYDVVSLHIPYGPGWDARRIERLIYQTDLGMNSPFNPKNEGRRLHRHPAFFGTMEECLEDCCEYCPEPKGEEECKLQEEEDKSYIRGRIHFIEEDPGRQSISGSFNPIDDGEWAEQAYMGATEKLFRAIATNDRAAVAQLMQQEGFEIDRRDYVGRTPLQMAILCKAVDIASDLIDAGARMTARLVDGRTALHLAAQLNLPDVVRKLLDRAEISAEKAREAEEEAKRTADEKKDDSKMDVDDEEDIEENNSEDDWSSEMDEEENQEKQMKSKKAEEKVPVNDDGIPDEKDEPDIFDLNVPDWDLALTPLQYAIIFGSIKVVDQLIAAGADVRLVTKAEGYDIPDIRQLTATVLDENNETAKEIAKKLFAAGAVSSEADEDLFTILHKIVCSGNTELVRAFLQYEPNAKAVVNTPAFGRYWNIAVYPIMSAITQGSYSIFALLLAYGAKLNVTEEEFSRFLELRKHHKNHMGDQNPLHFVAMPVESVLGRQDDSLEWLALVMALGAAVSLPTRDAAQNTKNSWAADRRITLIDWVRCAIRAIEDQLQHLEKRAESVASDELDKWASTLGWKAEVGKIVRQFRAQQECATLQKPDPVADKERLRRAKEYFGAVEDLMVSHGAKTWDELYPDNKAGLGARDYFNNNSSYILHVQNSSDLHYERRQGTWQTTAVLTHLTARYDELFEACANGDNAKVQKLCLPKQGNKSQEQPLQIVAQLTNTWMICNPLSLAVAGHHWVTARLILAIAAAQHHPEIDKAGKFQTRNIVLDDEEDNASDENEGDEDEMDTEEPMNFIDIAKRSSEVQTTATPANLLHDSSISWLCDDDGKEGYKQGSILFRAVDENDFEAFVQIADLYGSLPKSQPLPEATLVWLLERDRPEMLDEFIRRTGQGIDIEKEEEKVDEPGTAAMHKKSPSSKMYLGLNVHGKKRKDLAEKVDPNAVPQTESFVPPVVWLAARYDAQGVMQYLAGERALAAYKYYAATHSDERARFIRRAHDLAAVLPQWFGWSTNVLNESAMTAAVIGKSLEALKMLLSLRPKPMQQALSLRVHYRGYSHLLVAAKYGVKPELFDWLVEKGLSPLDVDMGRSNLLHVLCEGQTEHHFKLLQHVLERLSQDELERLLLQTTKSGEDTPLHVASKFHRLDIVQLLLEGNTRAITMRNVEGSTVLHIAIKNGNAKIAELLLGAAPAEALYMEDSVGNTPLETAIQRDLLRRVRQDFPCKIRMPDPLRQGLQEYTGRRSFDVAFHEAEIPRLKATVDGLLNEGRLRAGSKLATELMAFTEGIEKKLEQEKKERSSQDSDDSESANSQWQPEKDDDDPSKTLECLKKAMAEHSAAQARLLVHLSDVQRSVQDSLGAWPDRKKNVQKQSDGLDGEVEEGGQDKAQRRSILDHWQN